MASDLLPRRGVSGSELPQPVMHETNEAELFISVTFANSDVYVFLCVRIVQRIGNNKYVIKMAGSENSFCRLSYHL